MKCYRLLSVFLIFLTITACSSGPGEPEPDPEIESIQPDKGPVGTSVTISGSGFSAVASENNVTFSGKEAEITDAKESEIKAVVPDEAESGPVKIAVGEKTATGPSFTVEAESPVIESIEPDSGVAGTEVVISGLNFSSDASGNTVTFGGVEASVTEASETELMTSVPDDAADGPVELTVDGKSATGPDFDVITYGALEVEIKTEGDSKDEDGYTLQVEDESKDSEIDDIIYFNFLEEGNYDLEMKGIADNCNPGGENPLHFSITAGDTTSVQMVVNCEADEGGVKNKIVYSRGTRDKDDLYMMNTDGSGVTQLTEATGREWWPAISPDGTKVLYWRQDASSGNEYGSIWVMEFDSGNPVQLTDVENGIYNPVWSPDGEKIAFSAFGENGRDIFVMNADGTGRKNLTGREHWDSAPSWSPDGEKIAFYSDNNDIEQKPDIYAMDSDGSNIRKITHDNYYNTYPAWSPDGSKLAFLRSDDEDPSGTVVPGGLYTMDADGGNRKRITDLSVYVHRVAGHRPTSPSWSPDGSDIVFADKNGSAHEIYKVNANGSGSPEMLSEPEGINAATILSIHPHWSPLE